MTTGFSSNDSGSERSTQTRALATLLGVYAALYLGIVGAIHFATTPDAAAAVVPEVASLHVAVPMLPAEPSVNVGGVPGTELVAAEEPDNSRECVDGVDTSCIYN